MKLKRSRMHRSSRVQEGRRLTRWLPTEVGLLPKRRKPRILRTRDFQMTASVLRETELAIPIEDIPGAEESVLSTVTEQGTSVRALCSYNDCDQTVMLLVAEDPPRAKQALEDAGFDCWANPVVVVGLENRIGAIDQLGLRLHDAGINILRSYASYAKHEEAFAVFKTQDDERAIEVLRAGLCLPTSSRLENAA
jgi:hypothetical protein